MIKLSYLLNTIVIFILIGVQLAAFGVQIFEGEQPCPLCFLQRLGMTGVAVSLLLNLFFKIKPLHYGLAVLSSLMGGFVALRQISLHACPGWTPFGLPVLGLSLYTWSFIVFTCCILAVALLLLLFTDENETEEINSFRDKLAKTAFMGILLVTLGNIISSFWLCGVGPCSD